MKNTVGCVETKSLFIILCIIVSSTAAHTQRLTNPAQDTTALRPQQAPKTDLPSGLWMLPASPFRESPLNWEGLTPRTSALTGLGDVPGLLRASLSMPLPASSLDWQQKLTLTSCWRSDLARQQEYETVRMILGSIQAGGAAYLAYKYLKKYGLK